MTISLSLSLFFIKIINKKKNKKKENCLNLNVVIEKNPGEGKKLLGGTCL
jgi:carboxylesterase type B